MSMAGSSDWRSSLLGSSMDSSGEKAWFYSLKRLLACITGT